MRNIFVAILALFLWSCGSKAPLDVQSADFILSIQLPENRYIHQAQFIFPDTLKVSQQNFLGGDDITTIKTMSFNLSTKETEELLAAGSELFNPGIKEHYGFEEEGERTALLYELEVMLNGEKRNILVYNPRKDMGLPAPVTNYMKIMSGLMGRYKLE